MTGPDRGFWAGFAAESWQRAPVFVPGAFPDGAGVTGDDLHAGASAATEAWLREEFSVAPHLWSSAGRLARRGPELLPDAAREDGLQAWFDRVLTEDPEVMAYVREVHRFSRPIFEAVGRLMGGLIEGGGLDPAGFGRVDADVFLGGYRNLGFGVHKDANDNFMVGVHGCRQLRLWPPDAFDADVPLDAYLADKDRYDATGPATSRAPAGSVIYDVRPGDLLYWPVGWWHIGHCLDGRPAATFNINAWYSRSPLTDALQAAHRARKDMARALTKRELGGAVPPLSQTLADLEAFTAMTAPAADEAIVLNALRRRTARGMRDVPPPAPVNDNDLGPDTLLRPGPFPIETLRLADGDLAWSAGGHSDQGPADPGAASFLEALATLPSASAARLGDLLSRTDCGLGPATEQVTQLVSWGGLST